MFTPRTRRLCVVAIAMLATAVFAGCADEEAAPKNNNADVSFVNGMIPHHQSAVDMAKLAETNSTNETVKQLADRIEGAQQVEIDKMNLWLDEWNASHGDMNHEMGGMADMTASLQAVRGTEFDRMFLQSMTEHHRQAVDMANTELRDGLSPDAKELAQTIKDTQEAEMNEMQSLLASLT